jgi:NAD-dependent deacetylase
MTGRPEAGDLERARELVRSSRRPVVLTGAGFSAESGIPVFRGPGGLWEGHRPEELATPEAFARDPEKVWRWYAWRRERVDAARPHAGHAALAEWERRCPDLVVVTQNVDGLHQRSGNRRVLELHGSLIRARCVREGHRVADWKAAAGFPPRCRCGALLRPDVVWFGEALPADVYEAAAEAVARADLLVVAGTSAVVYPAAMLPELAIQRGVPVVEINPELTPLSPRVTVRLARPAGEALPQLLSPAERPGLPRNREDG